LHSNRQESSRDRADFATASAHDRRYDHPQHDAPNADIPAVKNFSLFFERSPDKLTFDDVREYHLHLASRKLEAQTINRIMCAIRFFYGTTLGKPNAAEHIPLARRSDRLPAILSRDEVSSFLNAVPSLKYRTAFTTICAAGLRISEAVALTIKDIEGERMVIP
jgi:integrase/recombinase XerD